MFVKLPTKVRTIPAQTRGATGARDFEAPVPPAAATLRTNLPAVLPSLIGRDEDLLALGALGDEAFAHLRREGALLPSEDVDAIAFAAEDIS